MNSPFDKDPLPTDSDHPNQTGIGEQTFVADAEVPAAPRKQVNGKKHHNIIDMYWFISEKIFAQTALESEEAGFLAIGYNADFANLRIGFHMPDQSSFTKSSMIKDKMKFLTTINIFSETAYNILDCLRTQREIKISNFERIIGIDNKWVPNQTQIIGNAESITIRTKNNEGTIYSYTFLNWQVAAFASALKYMTEGNSWNNYLLVRMPK
ncbi:MAG: hypothetical protein H8D97_00260 [Proteobacteria bacterium]|nr:hypothetical protein [Pseudomonadota bacterium]